MIKKIQNFFNSFKLTLRNWFRNLHNSIEQRPLSSFFVALIILLIFTIASNFLRRPAPETQPAKVEKKPVEIYQIGAVPKMSVQAQVEKTGVITITALMPGVINEINVEE